MGHRAAEVAPEEAGVTASGDWRAALVGGLVLVSQWLFLLAVAFLPVDAYLTLPTRQTGIFLSQVLTMEAALALVVTLVASRMLGRATGLQLAWRDLFPLGFVLVAAALSIIFATSRSVAIKDGLKVLVFLSIYVLARAFRDLYHVRRRVLLLVLLGFFLVLVSGFLASAGKLPDIPGILLNIHHSSAAIPSSTIQRAESTFRYPNELAAYLLIVLPILLACIITFPYRPERFAGLVMLALGGYLLVITYTRGALLALAISIPILLFLLAGRWPALVGVVAVLAGATLLALHGGATSERILSVFSFRTSGYQERIAAWRWAWDAFIHHPVFGVGIGNLAFQPNAPYLDQTLGLRETNAENLLLNVLAEMGIVGLSAVLYCLGGAFRMLWKACQLGGGWVDRSWNTGLFVALCGLIIFGVGDPVLVSGQVVSLLCMAVGVAGVVPGMEGLHATTRRTMAERLSELDRQIAAVPGRAALQARVIFLVNAPAHDDAAQHSIHLATELWHRGVGVLVVVPPNSPVIQRLTSHGIPCLGAELGHNIDRWPGFLGAMAMLHPLSRRRMAHHLRLLTQAGPAVFVCPFLREQLLVTAWSRRQGQRVIWTLPAVSGPRPRRLPLRQRWGALARAADAVVAMSAGDAVELRGLGLPAERITIAPGAVPSPMLEEDSAIERVPGLIVVIARFTKQQGIQYLIEALPSVLDRHPRARVAIVGAGRYERALYRLVYTRRLERQVDFLGELPDTSRLLCEASLYVSPAVDPMNELPVSMLDAFAAGTPVVASAVAPIAEVIVDQRTGILTWPGDAASIADALVALLDDPARAEAIGRAGREMVRSRYPNEDTSARWLQLLRRVEGDQDAAEPGTRFALSMPATPEKEIGDA